MHYNFIYDKIHPDMGFFHRVDEVGIKINMKTLDRINVKPESQSFYPLWSGDNELDKSKVELINQGKMKLLLISKVILKVVLIKVL